MYMLFSYLKWKHKSIWILITIWIIIPTLTAWFLNTHNKSAFLHRLHGVKVKLSYKIEGLERLFFQLINEKSTNLDKFPNWTTTKYWIPPFLFRLLKFQKKFPPLTCLIWNLGSPLYKGGEEEGGNCMKRKYKYQTQVSIFELKILQILIFSTGFTSLSVLPLFALLITFFIFVHGFWFYFIKHRWGCVDQPICQCFCLWRPSKGLANLFWWNWSTWWSLF